MILTQFKLAAIAAAAAAVLGAGITAWVSGLAHEAELSDLRADYAERNASAEREARTSVIAAIDRERAERERIEAEARAATDAAQARAKDLAARLARTQKTLATAIEESPSCAAWASQPLACPASWQVAAADPPTR